MGGLQIIVFWGYDQGACVTMQNVPPDDESFVATSGETHIGPPGNALIHMEGKMAKLYRFTGDEKLNLWEHWEDGEWRE